MFLVVNSCSQEIELCLKAVSCAIFSCCNNLLDFYQAHVLCNSWPKKKVLYGLLKKTRTIICMSFCVPLITC